MAKTRTNAKTTRQKTSRKTADQKMPMPTLHEGTKQKLIIDFLQRPEGATLAELADATGWQLHTVRGALAGTLKKRLGFTIVSEKRELGARSYRIKT